MNSRMHSSPLTNRAAMMERIPAAGGDAHGTTRRRFPTARAGLLALAVVGAGTAALLSAGTSTIGGADGSFENGLAGMVTTGAVSLVPRLGVLAPTQGNQALVVSTAPDEGSLPEDADQASLRIEGFTIPTGIGTLRMDYAFLTNEPTPSRTNDRFVVQLVLVGSGGQETLLAQDTFGTFYPAPWTGYGQQTGLRKLVADVSAHAGSGQALTLELRVRDTGDGRADSAVFIDNLLLATPDEPVARVSNPYVQVAKGEAAVLDGSGSSDDGGITEYRWELGDGQLAIGPVVTYAWQNEGVYRVRLRVTDASGKTSTQDVTIVVGDPNHRPIITSAPVKAAAQNVPYRYQARADDPELTLGDVLTWSLTEAPAGMTIDPASGLITWTPSATDPRKSSVTLRVEDRGGLSATQQFSVTIGPETYVVAANDNGYLYHARSFGDGTWTAPALIDDVGDNTRGATVADFDGDGDFDLITGSTRASNVLALYLYERDGTRFLAPVEIGTIGDALFPAGNWLMDLAAGDFDNDGAMDFAVNGDSAYTWVFMNRGRLEFAEAVFLQTPFESGGTEGWVANVTGTTVSLDPAEVNPTSGSTQSLKIATTANNNRLSARLDTSNWSLGAGSHLRFGYKVPTGVPAGFYVNVSNKGWLYLGGSPAASPDTSTRNDVIDLIDDGTWHTLDLDLYNAVKGVWPDAGQITQVRFWTNANAQAGQAFWIDDFIVTRRDFVAGFERHRLSSTGGAGRGLDAGDVDGDGDEDLVRGRYSDGQIWLYRNNGSGNFTASAAAVADAGDDPYGVLLADFDGDGAADIIGNQGSSGDTRFFKGNRSGNFQTGVLIPSLDTGYFASFGAYDFTNDGHQDVVAANYTSRQMLFYPGLGNAAFGPPVIMGQTAGNALSIAAPAGRVIGQPFAVVSADSEAIDVGGTVQFDASASFDDGVIGRFDWNFGDGTVATGATVSHTFNQEGDYKVIVTVTDNDARIDRRSIRIRVNGAPPVAVAGDVLFDESKALNGRWYGYLNGTGSSDDSRIVRYEWDLDAADGVTLADLGPTPRAVYAAPGSYTVTLRVTDVVGNTATATGTVTVVAGAAPVAALAGPDSLGEAAANLGQWAGWYDVTASSDDLALAEYRINWGDGTSELRIAPMADDFDDGNYAGWTVNGGSWSVVNGMLQQTDVGEAWRWLQDLSRRYQDFMLEVDFLGIEGPSDGYVGIVFRNANNAGSTNSFLLYSRASWDFWRFYDWQTDRTLAEGGSGWDHDTWYHLKLVVVGDTMRLWVTPAGQTESANPVLEVTNGAHPTGGIGLLTWGQSALFDNVKVTPLDTRWTANNERLSSLVHLFGAAADYTPTLTVRDHAGQQRQAARPLAVRSGAVPVAAAGGPYVLDEWNAWDGRWDFIGNFTGSNDDTAVARYRIDFGDGNVYTTAAADGMTTGMFVAGTDLYGYDVPNVSLQRIIATEDGTRVDVVNLATGDIFASTTLNRFQTWNPDPPTGTFFKVKASKPVVAYLTDLGQHSAFMPSLDGRPVGREFIIHRDANQGFYVYAFEDALVRFYGTNGALVAERTLRAGEYWATGSPLGETTYRVVASGRIAMQTSGGNGYTTVPSANGSPVGRLFYAAINDGTTAGFAVFGHAAADLQVFDLDSGQSLYTRTLAPGELWFQTGVGNRRLRIVSTGDVEVWAGSTEGGSGIVDLGDDISMTTGRDGVEFVLHELRDGIVIFAPNDATTVDIDGGLLTRTLRRDGYLLLSPADLPPLDVHRITANKPIVIQTLGRANGYNDLGTYLGGVSARNWYRAPGTYPLSLVAIDQAGQQSTPATTTVTVTQGDPPVSRITAPPEVGEVQAHGGRWPVHFDGTSSTDDSEIIRYVWSFGDGATATGAVVDHEYSAVGRYAVTLTTTDRAGQTHQTTWTIDVTQGAAPVADSGGPYVLGEAQASHGVWTANLDATGSTDDLAIYDYLWTLSPVAVDDFTATTLNGDLWQFQNATAAGNGVVNLAGTGGWGSAHLVAKQAYRRGPGTSVTGTVRANSTGENLMWGLKNLGNRSDYGHFAYAIHFDHGGLEVYEYGSHRGSFGSYNRNRDYEVRIDLKQPAGARYYIRALGEADWRLLYESANHGDTWLRPGATVAGGTFALGPISVTQTDERPITSLAFTRPGTYDLTLRVRDHALQQGVETTTVTVNDGAPPVARAGGPYQAEVGSLLTFDGSASSDDVAIQAYEWVFGDTTAGSEQLPYHGRGARTQHFYQAEGTYTATLTVTDNTGKTGTDTAAVTVITGQPPVADAGGPYVGGIGGPPVYFDGTRSSDDFGIVEYRWDFDASTDRDGDGNPTNDIDAVGPRPFQVFPGTGNFFSETFDGQVLDTQRWSASAGVTQDEQALVTGANNWGNRYLFANERIPRAAMTVQGQVRAPNARAMWGLKDSGSGYSYTNMPHALYFYNGTLKIYEMGADRGTVGSYTPGTLYDVRIDVKPVAGAIYYIKPATATQWTQLFDSSNRSDSPLRLGATVYNGTFEFDNFLALGPDAHTVTLTVEDGAGQTAVDTVTVTAPANLPPDVITVPWVANDLLTPHEAYNGHATRLKGIVRDADPVEYEWDFGDGTRSGRLPVTNPNDLSALHTYPDSPDKTPFTATLTVWDSRGQTGQDIYRVIVKRRNLTVETNVAIDDGLWFLHTRQTRQTDEGYPSGWWQTQVYATVYAASTAAAVQAFQINGHFEHGDHNTNPYAETVARGLRFLFTRLGQSAIARQTYGDPDTNGNGIGIAVTERDPIYQGGPVMDAIAASRSPLTRTVTGGDQVKRRRYFDILTDMTDQFAWGQYDHGSVGGGWRYSWNEHPDNSAAQWGAIGLQAAEDTFNIPIPRWVKERNDVWLNYSNDDTGFGYTGQGNGRATTPSGLVQLAFDDHSTQDPRWQAAEAYIAGVWSRTNSNSTIYEWSCSVPSAGTETCRDYYAMYAFTKAMRLARPAQVINLRATGLDWFDDPDNGIARVLIGDQLATGRFQGSNYSAWDMRSAWAIIMLSRTLFVERPVADAGDDSVWAINVPFTFDASNSYHPDPFRDIVRYEWDFDGDGVFDWAGSEPTVQHTFTDPVEQLPKTYTATLRVTDNNIPALTATDTVQVTLSIPPRSPIANAGGPYVCTQGVPCALDGSRSYDLDEPFDRVTAWGWELDFAEFPRDFDDATGPRPTHVFNTLGTFDVGLMVWDNGFLNDLNGNGEVDQDEKKTGVDYARVRVEANLRPTAVVDGPFTIPEGGSVTISAAGSSDPNGDALIYRWDLDGDGAYDDATGISTTFTGPDDGLYPIGLQVSDTLLAHAATTSVSVTNVAPVVSVGPAPSIPEGTGIDVSGSFTDPGADTWTATVDYGDGSGEQPLTLTGKTFNLAHVYAADGVYTVRVRVTDDDGATGISSLGVTVTDRGPTAALTGDVLVDEGQSGLYDAGASTSSPDPITGYEWDWAYDGGFSPSGTSGVTANHLWPESGNQMVAVRVTDADGSQDVASLAVTVRNLAPVVSAGPNQSAVPGTTISLAPATFTDAGVADTHSALIDWGDGTPATAGTVTQGAGSGSVAGSHAYAAPGTYTVTITVTDDEGASGQGSFRVQVSLGNLSPVANAGGPYVVVEGSILSLDGSASQDPDNGPSPLTFAWDLNDDGVFGDATGPAVELFAADDASGPVALRVSDGIATDTAVSTITITNAAPVVDAGADQTVPVGTSVTITAGFTDAGIRDSHTATIDWGDGTSGAGVVTQGPGSGTVTGSHSYAAPGEYSVRVTVTDDDAGNSTDSLTVRVQGTPPVQTIFDLRAAVKSGQVGLSWRRVAGAETYSVYRGRLAGGPYQLLVAGQTCTMPTCVYLDRTVTNGISYYYVVTSTDDGQESLFSNEVRATPGARR